MVYSLEWHSRYQLICSFQTSVNVHLLQLLFHPLLAWSTAGSVLTTRSWPELGHKFGMDRKYDVKLKSLHALHDKRLNIVVSVKCKWIAAGYFSLYYLSSPILLQNSLYTVTPNSRFQGIKSTSALHDAFRQYCSQFVTMYFSFSAQYCFQ